MTGRDSKSATHVTCLAYAIHQHVGLITLRHVCLTILQMGKRRSGDCMRSVQSSFRLLWSRLLQRRDSIGKVPAWDVRLNAYYFTPIAIRVGHRSDRFALLISPSTFFPDASCNSAVACALWTSGEITEVRKITNGTGVTAAVDSQPRRRACDKLVHISWQALGIRTAKEVDRSCEESKVSQPLPSHL